MAIAIGCLIFFTAITISLASLRKLLPPKRNKDINYLELGHGMILVNGEYMEK